MDVFEVTLSVSVSRVQQTHNKKYVINIFSKEHILI